MSKSKIPFQSNFDQTVRGDVEKASRRAGQKRAAKTATSTQRNRKPLKASVIDARREKIRLIKKILIWAIAVPLSILAIAWILVILVDTFSFLS